MIKPIKTPSCTNSETLTRTLVRETQKSPLNFYSILQSINSGGRKQTHSIVSDLPCVLFVSFPFHFKVMLHFMLVYHRKCFDKICVQGIGMDTSARHYTCIQPPIIARTWQKGNSGEKTKNVSKCCNRDAQIENLSKITSQTQIQQSIRVSECLNFSFTLLLL